MIRITLIHLGTNYSAIMCSMPFGLLLWGYVLYLFLDSQGISLYSRIIMFIAGSISVVINSGYTAILAVYTLVYIIGLLTLPVSITERVKVWKWVQEAIKPVGTTNWTGFGNRWQMLPALVEAR